MYIIASNCARVNSQMCCIFTTKFLAKKIAPEGAIQNYQSLFVANPEKEFIGFTSNFQYLIDTYRTIKGMSRFIPN
jgi:hypothetical protein